MKIENQVTTGRPTFDHLQVGDVFQMDFDSSYYIMTDEGFIVDLQTGELSSSNQYDSKHGCTVYEAKLVLEKEIR